MTGAHVAVAAMGVGLAGTGLYLAFHREPTPAERVTDALLSPIEAGASAVRMVPYVAPLVILLVILIAGVVLIRIASPGLAGEALKGALRK